MDQAAQFIDTVGFCLLFASTQAIELPSLFEAVKGRRNVHIDDWDADSDRVWSWKNELPADRRAYYGKALAGGKPVFISLEMLPFLFALDGYADVEEEYARGRLSYEAKWVYDSLGSMGPTPTIALRKATGLETARYHRALDELQRAFVVLPVGATGETGAWPSQIFDLVQRWFPRQVERAQRIDAAAARRAIVRRYVRTVVAAKPDMLMRVFQWSREQTVAGIDDLVRRRILARRGDWIVAVR